MKRLFLFLYMVSKAATSRPSRLIMITGSVCIATLVVTVLVQLLSGIQSDFGTRLTAHGTNITIRTAVSDSVFTFGDLDIETSRTGKTFTLSPIRSRLQQSAPGDGYSVAFLNSLGETTGENVSVSGTEFQILKAQSSAPRISGTWPTEPNEAIAGYQLASRMDLSPGSTVSINIAGQAFEFAISGVLQSGSKEDQSLLVDLAWLQRVLHADDQISELLAYLPGNRDRLETWARDLSAVAPEVDVDISSRVTYAAENLLQRVANLLFLIAAIVMIATTLGVMSTVGIILMERRREFGLLIALGTRRRSLGLFLLSESMIGATLAAAIAIPGGILLGNFIGRQIAGVDLGVSAHTLWVGIATAVLCSIMGCIAPLRTLARWTPSEMLKT